MTFKNDTEIKRVEDWRFVWWNLDADTEYTQAVTGTHPRLEWRHIQNIYGKVVHIPDNGELEVVGGECGYMQARLRCKACGKEFCADY